MYERMLDREEEPTIAQMTAYCGDCGDLFVRLNAWLSGTYETAQAITFPYGNQFGQMHIGSYWEVVRMENDNLQSQETEEDEQVREKKKNE